MVDALTNKLISSVSRRIAEEIAESEEFWEVLDDEIGKILADSNAKPATLFWDDGGHVSVNILGSGNHLYVPFVIRPPDVPTCSLGRVSEDEIKYARDQIEGLRQFAAEATSLADKATREIEELERKLHAADGRVEPDYKAMQEQLSEMHPEVQVWVRKENWNPFENQASIKVEARNISGASMFRHLRFATEDQGSTIEVLSSWIIKGQADG